MKLETLFNSLCNLAAAVRITPFTPFTAMQRHVKHPANLLVMFIMVQMFFACTQSDDPAARPGGELQVSVTASGYASIESGAPETRATEAGYATSFANGDQIGVTVLDGSEIQYNNIPYTFNGNTWAPSGADRAYIPSGTAAYLVYYPYSAAMDGKRTEAEIFDAFTVPADQGSPSKYAASDLMMWSGGMSAGATLNATLTHRLAMLEINLSAGAGNASVQVGAGGVISPWNISGTTWRCLVKPADDATVSGSHIAYATKFAWQQANVTLEAGKYTRLNVANSASTIEGYTGEIKVTYSDNDEVTIPASDIRWLTPGKTVKSITLSDYPGTTHLIGRVVDVNNLIKLSFDSNGDLLFRAEVDGFIPIGSYAEFQKISGSAQNKYRLEADLDLMNEEWTPIANSGDYFNGEFDGAGKQISNLTISVSGTFKGLFNANLGTIRDVHLVSSEITGQQYIGGICGRNESGGQIIFCSNAATVSGSAYVGGVAGDNSGTITACYNTCTVSGTGNNVGGVAGSNYHGAITACYNTGAVSGISNVGGVSGDNYGTNAIAGASAVTACYNTGAVSGISNVGGVVGYNNDRGAVTACYNTGTVLGSSSNIGSVAGSNDGTFTACYWKIGTATRAVGNQSNTPGITLFLNYPSPGTSGAWGTGTGGENGWWKAGINYTNTLPKLWYE